MKCTVFNGEILDVTNEFNRWAKGKALTKDVIIHTQAYALYHGKGDYTQHMIITVYHPEGSPWDSETQ